MMVYVSEIVFPSVLPFLVPFPLVVLLTFCLLFCRHYSGMDSYYRNLHFPDLGS